MTFESQVSSDNSPKLIIACANNKHFQSLLPVTSDTDDSNVSNSVPAEINVLKESENVHFMASSTNKNL